MFVDSTIFIYHATGASPQCRTLLERCEAGAIIGVTSVIVLAEVAHRLMAIEAVAKGLVSGKDVVKKLRARPDLVRRLHVYQEQVERIPLMGIDVIALELDILLRSTDVRRRLRAPGERLVGGRGRAGSRGRSPCFSRCRFRPSQGAEAVPAQRPRLRFSLPWALC